MGTSAPLFKICDLGDRTFGDIFHSFLGEESLMSGNLDVGESQQALKYIVLNNVIGHILKKQICLLFVHI